MLLALLVLPSTAAAAPPTPRFSRAAVLRTAAAAVALPAAPLFAIPPLDSPEVQAAAGGSQPAKVVEKIIYTPPAVKGASSREATALAKHLKEKGATLYGAYWCSHCFDQKQTFGASASKMLNYVECAEDGYNSARGQCRAKEIKGYPTWEIGGDLFAGEKTLEELAALSGFCDFRKGFCSDNGGGVDAAGT